MDHKSIFNHDYDKRIKFRGLPLFCYSVKKFKKDAKELARNGEPVRRIIGEIIEKEKSARDSDDRANIGRQSFALLPEGTKSRMLYRKAGYLSVEDGGYVSVLKSRLPMFIAAFFILLATLAALTTVSMALRHEAETGGTDTPVVSPLPVDPSAGIIEDDDSEKQESPDGGGSVTLTYSLDATLSLSDGNIDMYFLNPNASNHDISLALYLLNGEDTIKIAESGLIKAGYGLDTMTFIVDSAILSEGSYNAIYMISFYDEETGEKAQVETKIPDVDLKVEK